MIPAHLKWATDLARNVAPENNAYASSPYYLRWPGIDGFERHECRAKCNHFLNGCLTQAYGWDREHYKAWLDAYSPQAKMWHDAIVAGNRFSRILRVVDIAPGDILAVRYPEGEENTGHVMVASGAPALRKLSGPFVHDTIQYAIRIVDSSHSGHGSTDTRRQPDGTWADGAGEGVLRLYADGDGEVAGYSWSTWTSSEFFSASVRPFAIGRLR